MENIAVKLTKVSKKFILQHEKPTLIENIFSRKFEEEVWALKGINLTIGKGERLGIVGPNGSGKTTLLEIIAAITSPTSGAVKTSGRVVSLIGLGAGFQADLTGEENVILNGLLIGMSKSEVRRKMKKIVEFADIGKFISAPFYTYSYGMTLRLGFSVAVHADPEILLIDEIMAVGDEEFREKSSKRIREFFLQGKTLIMVSHYLGFLSKICDRAIWMDNGEIKKDGEIRRVIKSYKQSVK